jgi:lipopolysaccharide/colanic/teichoic acid biosynthesis glycosyltransferase
VNKLLYIGNTPSICESLEKRFPDALIHVKNVVGFYNQIDRLDEVDMVIAEYALKGIKGDELFERYSSILNEKKIPFVLITNRIEPEVRARHLRKGIIELIIKDDQLEVVADKIEFYRSMLEMRLSVSKNFHNTEYKIPIAKRIFDIAVAGTALLFISPVLLITLIAIRIESKGKVYYISKRVGTGYRVFDFYKLRSMYTDADQRVKELAHLNQYAEEAREKEESRPIDVLPPKSSPQLINKDGIPMSEDEYQELRRKQAAGTFVKFKNDPRVTKIGKIIRNTSIDELPQLINVLKGDMSIVGNRPLPLYEAEQLTSDDWGERFLAPAGITGLWQVEKRGGGSMSEDERKGLDNTYAQNFSFWNDIRLILRTIPALFQKENV